MKLRRRVLQTYWRITRGTTMGVRAVVRDPEGRLLLVRHTYTKGWWFPGGGIEKGETALDTLAHELRDEAMVTLTGAPTLFGIYANHAVFPNDHVLLYLVDAFEQSAFVPNAEIAACGFFAPDALPADTTPGTRRRLDCLAAGRPLSPHW